MSFSAVHRFVDIAWELKFSDERFPQREQVENDKKVTKDAFRDGYLAYVRQTDPELVAKVADLQAELKDKKVDEKEIIREIKEFICLNCRQDDLPIYIAIRELNLKGTAITKMVEWLQKPKYSTEANQEPPITKEKVLVLATRFIYAREKLRDTVEGKALREALKPFEKAIQALNMTGDDLARILKNSQLESPYVEKMARHFSEKK